MPLFARRTQGDKKFLASSQSEIGAGPTPPRSASVERVAQLCFQPEFRRAEIFSSGDCGVLPLASCVAEPMGPYKCMYGCIHAVFPCKLQCGGRCCGREAEVHKSRVQGQ
jgi:hypothetical protein